MFNLKSNTIDKGKETVNHRRNEINLSYLNENIVIVSTTLK
jgi:hypothetical protein